MEFVEICKDRKCSMIMIMKLKSCIEIKVGRLKEFKMLEVLSETYVEVLSLLLVGMGFFEFCWNKHFQRPTQEDEMWSTALFCGIISLSF